MLIKIVIDSLPQSKIREHVRLRHWLPRDGVPFVLQDTKMFINTKVAMNRIEIQIE